MLKLVPIICIFPCLFAFALSANSSDPDAFILTATFNTRGIKGHVTFTETVVSSQRDTTLFPLEPDTTTISVDYFLENAQWAATSSRPASREEVFITIREFPVVWGATGNQCADEALGKQLHSRTFQIGPLRLNTTLAGHMSSITIPLHSHQSILGRSILIITTKDKRACATITTPNPFTTRTAIARIRGTIAGDVYFRQYAAVHIHTTIFIDLYKLIPDGMAKNVTYKWLLMTTGPLDRTRPEDEASCRNMRVLFDPDFRDEAECSVENPQFCKIGNYEKKFGGLLVGWVNAPQKAFYTDTEFSLSGQTAGRRIYVAIFSPLNPLVSVACGEIRMLAPKLAEASFSQDGVKGVLKFRQVSPMDPTEVYVNLKGLASRRATTYQIHQFPRRQRILQNENLCSPALIGNLYDPFKASSNPGLNISVSTVDQWPVGDLSGRHGNLTGNDFSMEYFDENLPLFGPMSIMGRTVVIHDAYKSRWLCSGIWPQGETIMARVKFFYTVGGDIYLRQSADDWRSETTIFGNLYYTNGVPPNYTSNHPWRVHSGIVERDAFSFDDRCINALDVYNPLETDTRKNSYATECMPSRPLRCRLGDLSSKLQPLMVSLKGSVGNGRFLFTDMFLPLSGPMSVVGRSIVIYTKELGEDRLACGNIERVYPVKATAKQWVGKTNIKGFITASQASSFQDTEVIIGLEELDRAASSLTVHVGPVESDNVIPCTEESLGVDFNPLNASAHVIPPSNTTTPSVQTDDLFAVGDLSGKYGSLSGLISFVRQAFDENLPLTGRNSVIGRSVGVRQSLETRSLACADLVHDIDERDVKTNIVYAVAEFPGPFLWGYMRMFQVVYADGSTSPLTIQSRLAHMVNGSIDYMRTPSEHRWSVCQLPVATDASIIYEDFRCITAGLTDNYFNTFTEGPEYREECWAGNPTRCAYGDVTRRVGRVRVSFDERQVFTDDILQLKGNISLIGRSIVVYDVREGDQREVRLACGNILEEEHAHTTVNLQHAGTFNVVGFEDHVVRVANLSQWNVWIDFGSIRKMYQDSCIVVDINFRAPKAHEVMRRFTNLVDLDQFNFLGYENCDKKKYKKMLAMLTGAVTVSSDGLDDDNDGNASLQFGKGHAALLLFLFFAVNFVS